MSPQRVKSVVRDCAAPDEIPERVDRLCGIAAAGGLVNRREERGTLGFEVVEEVATRKEASAHRLLSPALQARVSAQENPYLSMLGWLKDSLSRAA